MVFNLHLDLKCTFTAQPRDTRSEKEMHRDKATAEKERNTKYKGRKRGAVRVSKRWGGWLSARRGVDCG